jgi:myo-inositol-1(or 4)-monophosphatase
VNLQRDLETAAEIAHEAGDLVLSYFKSDRVNVRSKGERDVVTAADTESERLIRDRLSAAFPEDGIVGEEGTDVDFAGRRRWYVDPVDGTLNYAHGLPIWCVSLTLFDGATPVLGVVRDPLRDQTFTARKGGGGRCNGKELRTSSVESAENALVHVTIDFNEASLQAGLRDIQRLAPRVLRTRNLGSAALALACVANGTLDAMVHRYAHPWDYGAGVLLVQESGGQVTEIGGGPYTVETEALIAAATPQLRAGIEALLGPVAQPHVE